MHGRSLSGNSFSTSAAVVVDVVNVVDGEFNS